MAKFKVSVILTLFLFPWLIAAQPQAPEKTYLRNQAMHPDSLTQAFARLDAFPQSRWVTWGMADAGRPLGALILGDGDDPLQGLFVLSKNPKLLILNGIHPGESCGMDASLHWADSLLRTNPGLLRKVVVVIIPVYNSGGALNRGCCWRANQVGPAEQGFRGNRQNLDLNRDFIKADAPNTAAFYTAVQRIQPDYFLDTHTTDGADYPYAMTLLFTQQDRLGPELGRWIRKEWEPWVYKDLAQQGFPAVPYVNVFGDDPLLGYPGFMDSPRFSSGFMALQHIPGVVSEAHMLKTYPERVKATRAVIHTLTKALATKGPELQQQRRKAIQAWMNTRQHPLQWTLDSSKFQTIDFQGYMATERPSTLGDYKLVHYDQSAIVQRSIPYYGYFKPVVEAAVPAWYVIPSAYRNVIDRLLMNGVDVAFLAKDTVMSVRMSYLRDFKAATGPYEGHFYWRGGSTRDTVVELTWHAGDALVSTRQPMGRYVFETLEPLGDDSFVRWNFFDAVFDRKEYFSPYLFEETAVAMLRNDPELARQWAEEVARQPDRVRSDWQTLMWFYERWEGAEPTYRRYPVGRSTH